MSEFYIVNDFDRPDERYIAQRRENGKFYYVHPSLIGDKRYHGMTPDRPTPIEDFGIVVEIGGGFFRGRVINSSGATYRDGRPRQWQGEKQFKFTYHP